VLLFENNFHGRTTTIISFSNDENDMRFHSFTEFIKIPYDDIDALEAALKIESLISAGFSGKTIQGRSEIICA
jgi:ornithine--oxo-acid transaminase